MDLERLRKELSKRIKDCRIMLVKTEDLKNKAFFAGKEKGLKEALELLGD